MEPREQFSSKSGMIEIAREIYALGISLFNAGRTHEAEFQFKKALLLRSDLLEASLGLGCCLHSQGEYARALEIYDRALQITPKESALWNNRGNTLLEMCFFDQAAVSFLRALKFSPGLQDARIALATCYQAMGLIEEAMASCDSVLSENSENAEAHWNRSLLLLLTGNYTEGWREYEWRWRKRNFTSPYRNFQQPLWRGESLEGRTILIHAEQGFGDTIQFCRYIPLVAELGANIIFECHPPLVELMKTVATGVQVIAMGQTLPCFDLHVPLMSLPFIFGTTVDNIPASIPYLYPPEDRLPFWTERFRNVGQIKVGVCWAGKSYPDPRRSCPVEFLQVLAPIRGVSWYSLQFGWRQELPLHMIDFSSQIHDFADTAALISQLDFVITIDTAVAHLAGALGRPSWVMLPQAPDWRWMLVREDSPWYPKMKLLRLKKPDAWLNLMERIGSALEKYCRRLPVGNGLRN